MGSLPQNLPHRKRKSAVVPPRGFTWEGVLESATIELEKANACRNSKRCRALRESMRIAQKNINEGKPFPVSPITNHALLAHHHRLLRISGLRFALRSFPP
jgi:hypothetical protein